MTDVLDLPLEYGYVVEQVLEFTSESDEDAIVNTLLPEMFTYDNP